MLRTLTLPARVLRLSAYVVALSVAVFGSAVLHSAPPTELFFSEYIEGSSNSKALEIYNGTGGPINLATDGYNVQMFFNGNPVSTLTINLTGTVAAGDVFVLAQASASAAILAQADQTNGSGWFNGDDAVVLRKGTTVIDSLGQVGTDPGARWGTAPASTENNTLRRKAAVCGGDSNSANSFDPATEWDGFAQDTVDGLGSHTASCGGVILDVAPTVTSTTPSDGAVGVPVGTSLLVTFSEPVAVNSSWFTLSCTTSGAVAATVTGGPTTFTIDPLNNFAAGESCTLTVLAAQVSDVDADDPPDAMAADRVATFSTPAACGAPFTPIPQIQGTGTSAAVTGSVVTEGVVVGDFEGSAGLQGFYLQDSTGDGNPATSDGIFVYTGSGNLVSAGQRVRVSGFARERFNQTTINGANANASVVTDVVACGDGTVPAPTDVTLPFSAADFPERFEGMLVRFPQALVISEYFNLERFGEIVLAKPLAGESRPYTPTAIDGPGPAADDRAAANLLSRITLDDGLSVQNPEFVRHPNGFAFDLTNRFRGGDTVQDAVGVLGFDFSLYRIYPTGPATYTSVNPRPAALPAVGGALKVAAMNTLNFFLTLNDPGTTADDVCGGAQNLECRGANSTEATEFDRQRAKLLSALLGLNADVVGLNEIENTPGVDPLDDPTRGVVAGLNDILGAGTYASINTGVIGTDAIRVGLIYKPAKVTPVGVFKILDSTVDSDFLDGKNRPSLAQTFADVSNGAKLTIAVNHFKSKGSDCNDVGDPDLLDLQGNCNVTRRAAAQALVDWLSTDPTGSGDPDFLIVGDLNSYAKEHPIDAIRAGSDDAAGTADDFTNLIAKYQGPLAYSYAFDGQFGYLDHALGSFRLVPQTTGAGDWHINADEPDLLDYDTSFKPAAQEAIYEPNAFRASDHDAVIVGVTLCASVNGTTGRDALTGSSGRDCIVGREGGDILTGGGGPDLFTYVSMRDAGDTVTDFAPAQDVVDLSTVLRGLGFAGGNALTAGWVRVIASGAVDSVVQIDQDGPGTFYTFRPFVTIKNVAPAAVGQAQNFVF